MAGPYRGQLLLSTADAGWSETYYIPGASMTAAISAMQSINTDRMGLSRSDVTCQAIRVVDVTTPRTASLVAPNQATGTYTGVSLSTVDPAISLMAREVSADFLTRSRHYLRGMPSEILNGSASDPLAWTFTAAFTTAFNAWIATVLANANLGVKTAPHTYTLKSIQSISHDGFAVIRRAGRPFNQRRGRRQVA